MQLCLTDALIHIGIKFVLAVIEVRASIHLWGPPGAFFWANGCLVYGSGLDVSWLWKLRLLLLWITTATLALCIVKMPWMEGSGGRKS